VGWGGADGVTGPGAGATEAGESSVVLLTTRPDNVMPWGRFHPIPRNPLP